MYDCFLKINPKKMGILNQIELIILKFLIYSSILFSRKEYHIKIQLVEHLSQLGPTLNFQHNFCHFPSECNIECSVISVPGAS